MVFGVHVFRRRYSRSHSRSPSRSHSPIPQKVKNHHSPHSDHCSPSRSPIPQKIKHSRRSPSPPPGDYRSPSRSVSHSVCGLYLCSDIFLHLNTSASCAVLFASVNVCLLSLPLHVCQLLQPLSISVQKLLALSQLNSSLLTYNGLCNTHTCYDVMFSQTCNIDRFLDKVVFLLVIYKIAIPTAWLQ